MINHKKNKFLHKFKKWKNLIEYIKNFRNNMGGVVRIVKDPKPRLNDNSQMAFVEFLDK